MQFGKTIDIKERRNDFEQRVNSHMLEARFPRGPLTKYRKGDGYLGGCGNGRFEVYMPVALGSSDTANIFGSCIYGKYTETENGLEVRYSIGRTLAARIIMLAALLQIVVVTALVTVFSDMPVPIAVVIGLAAAAALIIFLHIPRDDRNELFDLISGPGYYKNQNG